MKNETIFDRYSYLVDEIEVKQKSKKTFHLKGYFMEMLLQVVCVILCLGSLVFATYLTEFGHHFIVKTLLMCLELTLIPFIIFKILDCELSINKIKPETKFNQLVKQNREILILAEERDRILDKNIIPKIKDNLEVLNGFESAKIKLDLLNYNKEFIQVVKINDKLKENFKPKFDAVSESLDKDSYKVISDFLDLNDTLVKCYYSLNLDLPLNLINRKLELCQIEELLSNLFKNISEDSENALHSKEMNQLKKLHAFVLK